MSMQAPSFFSSPVAFPSSCLNPFKMTVRNTKFNDKLELQPLKNKVAILTIVGDCHNRVKCVEEVLKRSSSRDEEGADYGEEYSKTILFLGNFFGSCEGFLPFVNFLTKLKEDNQVICLRGYNEKLLLDYLMEEELTSMRDYYDQSRLVNALSEQLGYPFKEVIERKPEVFRILKETEDFYENDNYIFSPGAIPLNPGWKASYKKDFYQIKSEFLTAKNQTGKKIVFTNFSASDLNAGNNRKSGKDFKLWYNYDENKYCLNGNPECQEGKVLALFIDHEDIHPISSRISRNY